MLSKLGLILFFFFKSVNYESLRSFSKKKRGEASDALQASRPNLANKQHFKLNILPACRDQKVKLSLFEAVILLNQLGQEQQIILNPMLPESASALCLDLWILPWRQDHVSIWIKGWAAGVCQARHMFKGL